MRTIFLSIISTAILITTSCREREAPVQLASAQQEFWGELGKLGGKAFSGTIVSAPSNDTLFTGKELVMHVRMVEDSIIKVPFFVGDDSSRTWVFTIDKRGITLKHDHRHADGTPDELTMYGGTTSNSGWSTCQVFPADWETVEMLPGAVTNVWWIDLVPGEHFTYNLRRVNTDRLFSVRFNLSQDISAPGKPWGWDTTQ